MKRILLIDDQRITDPKLGYVVVVARNPQDGLKWLKMGIEWEMVLLDHDLGQDNRGKLLDIRPVVDWLDEKARAKEKPPIQSIGIITMNPVGQKYLKDALSRHYPLVMMPSGKLIKL